MFQAPAQTPHILTLFDDLPTRDTRAVGRHLGVSARTIGRWMNSGNAPRMAHLALFWESRWGVSLANVHAINGERIAVDLARALQAENDNLRRRIQRLEELGDFGAANAPVWAHR
jgi:predicted site-specific integrase-resolvase